MTVQAQVLQVMRRMQEDFGTAIIMITHDLGVIAEVADEVVVMYAGAVMETADRDTTFYESHHPYTEGLLQSLPAYGKRDRLQPIAGQPPSLISLPPGCPFPEPLRLLVRALQGDAPAAAHRHRRGAPLGLLATDGPRCAAGDAARVRGEPLAAS